MMPSINTKPIVHSINRFRIVSEERMDLPANFPPDHKSDCIN